MLEVTDGAVLMLSLLLFFDSEGLLPAFFAAAVLHEGGHLLALYATGGELRRLAVTAVGGRMDCRLPEGRARCFAVHFAGAAMNFAAFLLLRALGFPRLAGANFVLAVFNLLPVCPLDGYACLGTLLGGAFYPAGRAVSLGFAALLTAAGSWLFCTGRGASLAAAGVFLLVISCKNLQKY